MIAKTKFENILDSPKLPVAIIIASAVWVGVEIKSMRNELEAHLGDRISGSCFIAIQDELAKQNPNMKWLDASQVRRIQRTNPPYNMRD